MNTYMIGYDLNRPRGKDDYPDLINKIKEFELWWHHLDSNWIVKTNFSSTQIRDILKPFVDDGDELLVAKLSGEAAWIGFNEKGSQWLKSNL